MGWGSAIVISGNIAFFLCDCVLTLGCLFVITGILVAQGAVTIRASPGRSYLVGPGSRALGTLGERQSDISTTELVRIDLEVRKAVVGFHLRKPQ